MTLCACIAGAKVSYGSNGATVSTLKKRLTENGDYKVLEASEYLSNADYLQRGDVLANSGHTVMILDNGSKVVPGMEDFEDSPLDITNTKIAVTLKNIEANKIKISTKIFTVSTEEEILLKDTKSLNLYKWSYEITSLLNKKEKISSNLKISTNTKEFEVSGLKANNPYVMRIIATEKSGTTQLTSASIVFNTPYSLPSAVSNLTVSLLNNEKFVFRFAAPSSWGTLVATRYYRLILFVNGKDIAYSDSFLNPNTSYENSTTEISLASFGSRAVCNYGDTVQIGILPMYKDAAGIEVFNTNSLRCSRPFYISYPVPLIDKVYTNIKNVIKRVVVYKK
jgi:hypothetical protein